MSEQQKILSICIPTYNRAIFLKSALLSIYNQTDKYSDFEVVVSDNASSDNTEFVASHFLEKQNFRYFKQSKNLGFSGNIISVVKHASAKYCWVVGDDDFILPNRIQNIISILKSADVDFVYTKVEEIHVNDYKHYLKPFHTGMIPESPFEYQHVGKWEELLRPQYSIFFLGEVMASIFRREVWLSYTPDGLDEPYMSNVETTYTHSVIFANTFIGKSAIYIKSPTVLAVSGAREWWDKVGYIILVHVRSLLKLYQSKGVSKSIMQECWDTFIKSSTPYAASFFFNSKLTYRDKVPLKEYYKEMLALNKQLVIKENKRELKQYLKGRYQHYKNSFKRRIKRLFKPEPPIPPTEQDINLETFERNQVIIAKDFKVSGKISIVNVGKITIDSGFQANAGQEHNPIGGDTNLRINAERKNSVIKIGKNVGISNSTIVCWDRITIEDNVMIGGGTKIWDTNFHSLDPFIRTSGYDDNVQTKPILIKENAFIGGSSIVLKGVTIGRNSIIAAGSVVVKDIPDNVIAGGNPCRVLKSL